MKRVHIFAACLFSLALTACSVEDIEDTVESLNPVHSIEKLLPHWDQNHLVGTLQSALSQCSEADLVGGLAILECYTHEDMPEQCPEDLEYQGGTCYAEVSEICLSRGKVSDACREGYLASLGVHATERGGLIKAPLTLSDCRESILAAQLSLYVYPEAKGGGTLPDGLSQALTYSGEGNLGYAVGLTSGTGDERVCYGIFRGLTTEEERGVIFETESVACAIEDGSATLGGDGTKSCVKGFWSVYQALRVQGAVRHLRLFAESGLCPGGVTLAGHSLGGALASMTAAELRAVDPERYKSPYVRVFSYGAPRAVAPGLADTLQSEFSGARYVDHGDIIPSLPLSGYKHFGRARELYRVWIGGPMHIAQKPQDFATPLRPEHFALFSNPSSVAAIPEHVLEKYIKDLKEACELPSEPTPPGGTPKPVPGVALCQTRAMAYCRAAVRCGKHGDEAACVTDLCDGLNPAAGHAFWYNAAHIAVDVDVSKIDACANWIPCQAETVWNQFRLWDYHAGPCAALTSAQLAVGADCQYDVECQDSMCIADSGGALGTLVTCGTCQVGLAEGVDCTTGGRCQSHLQCTGGTCQPYAKKGQSCTGGTGCWDPNDAPLVCDQGTCKLTSAVTCPAEAGEAGCFVAGDYGGTLSLGQWRTLGGACGSATEETLQGYCAAPLACTDSACAEAAELAPVGYEEPCKQKSQCPDDAACQWDAAASGSICVPLAFVGEPCTSHLSCFSGFCQGAVCVDQCGDGSA